MEFSLWLSLLLVCALGAAMPGPSLAVVAQNTIRGGFGQGVVTSLAHALAVGVYALLTVTGLAVILKTLPTVFWAVQLAGALFLIYLGLKTWLAKPAAAGQESTEQSGKKSAWDGFLIAFLNPKLFIFFTALFSQFVDVESSWLVKAVMVATATLTDGLWYCLVAFLLTRGQLAQGFANNAVGLQRVFALILMALGLRLVVMQF
jgi:threonine efflux protein